MLIRMPRHTGRYSHLEHPLQMDYTVRLSVSNWKHFLVFLWVKYWQNDVDSDQYARLSDTAATLIILSSLLNIQCSAKLCSIILMSCITNQTKGPFSLEISRKRPTSNALPLIKVWGGRFWWGATVTRKV